MEERLNELELNDNIYLNKEQKTQKKNNNILLSVLGILFIFIVFIVLNLYNKKISHNLIRIPKNIQIFKDISIIGEINCVYDIQEDIENTRILGNEFLNESKLDIYIDNKKIKYNKEYKFNSTGIHYITFKLYNNLNMDYMFKDIQNLISVEMISKNNGQILSMISAFENCVQLINFTITGFNVENVKSMKKLFYNTSLSKYYFSS